MNKIRRLCVLLVPLLFASGVLAQNGGTDNNQDNLYSRALLASIVQMHKEWGHIDNSADDTVRTGYHHVFVKADPEITDHLPTEFGEYHVEYLGTVAQIERYRKLKKKFSILEIHPIHSQATQLKITVSVSYVSYKKSRLMFEVSDWSDVVFHFDCDKQMFTVSSVKLGGV